MQDIVAAQENCSHGDSSFSKFVMMGGGKDQSWDMKIEYSWVQQAEHVSSECRRYDL